MESFSYVSKEVRENVLASEGKSCRPETAETPGETTSAEKQYTCHDLSV